MRPVIAPRGPRRALVRTDASVSIGTGHLMRCMTLADHLAMRGWSVQFASRALPAPLLADIRSRGHGLIRIPVAVPMDEEPGILAGELASHAPDLTIIDHYGIGEAWQRDARRWSGALMAIDDLAAAPLDVDLLLNQNLGEREGTYDGLLPESCISLLGPRYALLRPQFRAARGPNPPVRRQVKRVLIFLSGADEPDATRIAAGAVERLGIASDVVVGAAYPHLDRLRAWARGARGVTLHQNVADMAGLMLAADLAIGAPSSASWERCCVGLPTILVTLADNQIRAGEALVRAGAAVNAGWHSDVDEAMLASCVAGLAKESERLAAMSRAAAAITDGRGVERVSDAVDELVKGDGTHA